MEAPAWLRLEMILPSCRHLPGKALRKFGAGSALLLLLSAQAPWGWSAGAGESGADAARIGARLREILLGGPGQPILCPGCPSEPAIRVDVASGLATEVPLPYRQIHSIAPFPDGKRILAATSPEKGKGGLLLVLSAESLAPQGRVEIPGNGVRIAIAPDGYSAYVLCHRPGRRPAADPDEGRWELVVANLGTSAVTETYPLPEAQVDRFMMKVLIDYPSMDEEKLIIRENLAKEFPKTNRVLKPEDIIRARDIVREVYMDEKIENYILSIVFASRDPEKYGLPAFKNMISYGASPRASIYLSLAAKAFAFIRRRGYVIPEDVRAVCADVMRHRIGLTYEAEAENINQDKIIADILNVVEVP